MPQVSPSVSHGLRVSFRLFHNEWGNDAAAAAGVISVEIEEQLTMNRRNSDGGDS